MPHIDRFLNHRPSIQVHRPLGLGYSLVRETWAITADPKSVPPSVEVIASRRSASDAADLGRTSAKAFERHGFHKASGAWWAAEEGLFHRFAVRPRHRTRAVLALGLGVAGLAALGLAKATRRPGASKSP